MFVVYNAGTYWLETVLFAYIRPKYGYNPAFRVSSDNVFYMAVYGVEVDELPLCGV